MSAAPVPPDGEPPARTVARWFHDEYERLAPDFGYRTREESAVPWVDVPDANRDLMIATAECVLRRLAAGRAAATPDPPTDERRPWPIAPDTVMPPRRQPVRWGSRADDPPTEIHDDPGKTKAYLAGLAAGRTEAAAASPDERLREAAAWLVELAAAAVCEPRRFAENETELQWKAADAITATRAALAAADREAPDEAGRAAEKDERTHE